MISRQLASIVVPSFDQPLHVLLRHRLLPQPDSFEGRVPHPCSPITDALAVGDVEHLPHTKLRLHAAAAAAPSHERANHDPIVARLADLLDIEMEALPHLKYLLQPTPHTLMAAISLLEAGKSLADHFPFDVRMEALGKGIDVALLTASVAARTSSTFSRDIAGRVSPGEGDGQPVRLGKADERRRRERSKNHRARNEAQCRDA